jgi:protein phosphatase
VLSRCLGQDLIVSIDTLSLDVQAGDILVQCSDGVHGLISDSEMAEIIRRRRPEEACRAVVERARTAGGDDNLSVQIALLLSSPPSTPASWWRFGR